ncbi:MAG: TolC family protein, partial [Planctomycetota bacterium]
RTPWSGGFTADLPLDRLPERNAYRSSLIAFEAAKRAVDLAGDTIQANIRDQLRQVRATRQTYQIQTNSVDLAARRVESTRLNLEAGRSSTRDVLESQRALLSAQNAATRALIDYSLTRLRLFNEAELLTIDKTGIIVDNERLADLLRT